MTNEQTSEHELDELKSRLADLEAELRPTPEHWEASASYLDYNAASGFMLGMFGAIASLLFNILGSLAIGQHPLRLIQVYLTFPLGEKALSPDFDSGVALAVGCCLYVGTGMILGVPFQIVMSRALPKGTLFARLGLATVIGILMWAVNFYLILSWLQPLLFGGNWITNSEFLPAWVGGATHVVFAWTMALMSRWGQYEPYRRQTDLHRESRGEEASSTDDAGEPPTLL